MRCSAFLWLAVFLIVVSAQADAAEPTAEDRVLATALFKQGRRLLDAGDIATACRKFEESERLDPSGGTLLNLAACHEREGRTASAWMEFTEALALARRDGRSDRAQVASERIAVLEPSLAQLVISVGDKPAADQELLFDGSMLRRPAWGSPFPVDPGPHTVEAHAPGMRTWRLDITVPAEQRTVRVDIPPLERAPSEESSAHPPPPAPLAIKDRSSSLGAGSNVRDVGTVGIAAVGVCGVAIGTYFGFRALSQSSEADSGCQNGHCTTRAAGLSERASTSADASTVAFAIGVPALAAAAVLLLTRRNRAPTIAAGPSADGAWLVVNHRF